LKSAEKEYAPAALLVWIVTIFLFMSVISCTRTSNVARIISLRPEGVKKEAGGHEPTKLEWWRQLVHDNRQASLAQKLIAVNDFFNGLDYIEDRQLWGRDDYWATLTETLKMHGGDCEDISIAKYFTLSDLNVPVGSMRLTYVISLKTKQPHMVLTVVPAPSQEPIVLDSMNNDLLPASRRADLVPVFSFNTQGYWLARKKQGWMGERIGGAERLSMWQDVLSRMRRNRPEISGG